MAITFFLNTWNEHNSVSFFFQQTLFFVLSVHDLQSLKRNCFAQFSRHLGRINPPLPSTFLFRRSLTPLGLFVVFRGDTRVQRRMAHPKTVCNASAHSMRVCVCVWEREKETEYECGCVCVCVCERDCACVGDGECVWVWVKKRKRGWFFDKMCIYAVE